MAILDEADDLPNTEALKLLEGHASLSVIVVAHDPAQFTAQLDDPGRFGPEHKLRLDRYGVATLSQILQRRAEAGLEPGSWEQTQLERIADEVAGVAREAIQALRAAAELADERNHQAIQEADVDDSFARARSRIRRAALGSLPFHHQVLFSMIEAAGEIQAGELHDWYEETADAVYRSQPQQPIGRRARRNKLRKLVEYDLVAVEGEKRHRIYSAVDETVQGPVTIDPNLRDGEIDRPNDRGREP